MTPRDARPPGTLLHRPVVPPATHAAELRRSRLPPNRPPPIWWEPVCALAAMALAGGMAGLVWLALEVAVARGGA